MVSIRDWFPWRRVTSFQGPLWLWIMNSFTYMALEIIYYCDMRGFFGPSSPMARIIWSWQCCRLLVGNIANGIAAKTFFAFLTELGNFKQKNFWRQCHWQCCQTKVCSIVKTRWFGPMSTCIVADAVSLEKTLSYNLSQSVTSNHPKYEVHTGSLVMGARGPHFKMPRRALST